MPAPRLVLTPRLPDWTTDDAGIIVRALQDIQLIDDSLPVPGYFSAGPAFLDYLSFLGCAPTVVFEPPASDSIGSGDFYHFHIATPSVHSVLRSDGFSYTPKCPGCKEALSSWREWWPDQKVSEQLCPACGAPVSPEKLNWRRRAGCGRLFIDVLGIHAETVKPVPLLFERLEQVTGTAWQYFFVEDDGLSSS